MDDFSSTLHLFLTRSQSPTTCPHHQRPAPHHQRPDPHHQRPASHHQRPAPHHQRLAPHHQRPASHHQQPVSHYQRSAPHHQRPTSHHQRPASAIFTQPLELAFRGTFTKTSRDDRSSSLIEGFSSKRSAGPHDRRPLLKAKRSTIGARVPRDQHYPSLLMNGLL